MRGVYREVNREDAPLQSQANRARTITGFMIQLGEFEV